MPEQEETRQEESAPKKKGCLGCSFPLIIGFLIVFLALFLIGFASGPLGKSIIGDIGLPSWLSVSQPHPELPAEVVFHLFVFPITNSVIAAWLTIIVLVGFSYAVSHRMKIIPGRLQAVLEFIMGALLNFCQSVAGEKRTPLLPYRGDHLSLRRFQCLAESATRIRLDNRPYTRG